MYIRFKDIPEGEVSGVHDGDLGKIRDEAGVSCYECVKQEEFYKIILPSMEEGCLYDLIGFMNDFEREEIPAYLIIAKQVGIGTHGEPVVKDIEVFKELTIKEFADPKPQFKMDRTNKQLVIK